MCVRETERERERDWGKGDDWILSVSGSSGFISREGVMLIYLCLG